MEDARVHLAVCGERQLIQRNKKRGHHVIRQALPKKSLQLLRSRRGLAARDKIREQLPAPARVGPCRHDASFHARVGEQSGFYFAGFNSKAADLNLFRDTAQKLYVAFGKKTDQVTGSVKAFPGTEWVWDKFIPGQFRGLKVSCRQAIATHIQLARHTDGDWLRMFIQDVTSRIRNGPADRHRAGAVERCRNPIRGGESRILRRTIAIYQGR